MATFRDQFESLAHTGNVNLDDPLVVKLFLNKLRPALRHDVLLLSRGQIMQWADLIKFSLLAEGSSPNPAPKQAPSSIKSIGNTRQKCRNFARGIPCAHQPCPFVHDTPTTMPTPSSASVTASTKIQQQPRQQSSATVNSDGNTRNRRGYDPRFPRSTRNNPRGYPPGSCFECGSSSHLRQDCPNLQ